MEPNNQWRQPARLRRCQSNKLCLFCFLIFTRKNPTLNKLFMFRLVCCAWEVGGNTRRRGFWYIRQYGNSAAISRCCCCSSYSTYEKSQVNWLIINSPSLSLSLSCSQWEINDDSNNNNNIHCTHVSSKIEVMYVCLDVWACEKETTLVKGEIHNSALKVLVLLPTKIKINKSMKGIVRKKQCSIT